MVNFTVDDLVAETSLQVTCLTNGFLVMVSATSGRQTTSWTTSGFTPQASRQALIPPMNHNDDQATCSEHFTTTVFPANNEARMGEMRL